MIKEISCPSPNGSGAVEVPFTNADMLHSKSDKELACCLSELTSDCEKCLAINHCSTLPSGTLCEDIIYSWLQEEYKE